MTGNVIGTRFLNCGSKLIYLPIKGAMFTQSLSSEGEIADRFSFTFSIMHFFSYLNIFFTKANL